MNKKKVTIFPVCMAVGTAICFKAGIDMNEAGFYKQQWSLSMIKAEKMWSIMQRNKPVRQVKIAVIDSGIDFSHEDLQDVNFKQFILTEEEKIQSSHGTSVVGIISAEHNRFGIHGIASTLNPEIIFIKIKTYPGVAEKEEIRKVIRAISIAEENGAELCNLSFSTTVCQEALRQSMKKSKMLFIVSAGNAEVPVKRNVDYAKVYPASFHLNNVVSVASCDRDRKLAADSNYGKSTIDLVAPGSDILTLSLENRYHKVAGTSFAAPHVTGAIRQALREE